MLSSISIKGFKAIQGEEPLELKNLGKVNYLVGPNGSGKSSVLEALHTVWLINCCFRFFQEFRQEDYSKDLTYYDYFKRLENVYGLPKARAEIIVDNVSILLGGHGRNANAETNPCAECFYHKGSYNYQNFPLLQELLINTELNYITNNYKWFNPEIFNFLIQKNSIKRYSKKGDTTEVLPPDEKKDLFMMYFNFYRLLNLFGSGKHVGTPDHLYWQNKSKLLKLRSSLLKRFGIDDISVLTQTKETLYYYNDHFSSGMNRLYELVNYSLLEKTKCSKKIVLIDEPEIFLHPETSKVIPEILNEISKRNNTQFFISTHSPFIVNAALEQDDQKVYHLKDGRCLNSDGISKKSLEKTEEKISSIYSIHGGLGMVPSDLLFANCMIWVEGPTDAIYIEFWLRKYCEENTKDQKQLKKGFDYDFSLFGGASAENFYLLEDDYEFEFDKEKEDQQNKIFDMLKIHPKSFVVMDNDWNQEKECGDSNFEGFKTRIKESKISYHYEESKSIHTIELYRKDISEIKKVSNTKKYKSGDLKHKRKTLPNKKKFAFDYTKQYKDSTLQECLKPEGIEMINKIYTFITQPT